MDAQAELHHCIDGGMEKLVAIWDDIGILGEQRSARNRVVLMHLGNLLDEMVREEDQLRTRLKQNVEKYQTEVTRLCTELCLPLYEVCYPLVQFTFLCTVHIGVYSCYECSLLSEKCYILTNFFCKCRL